MRVFCSKEGHAGLIVPSVRRENRENEPKQALRHYLLKTELRLSHSDSEKYRCWIMVHLMGLSHREPLGGSGFPSEKWTIFLSSFLGSWQLLGQEVKTWRGFRLKATLWASGLLGLGSEDRRQTRGNSRVVDKKVSLYHPECPV